MFDTPILSVGNYDITLTVNYINYSTHIFAHQKCVVLACCGHGEPL